MQKVKRRARAKQPMRIQANKSTLDGIEFDSDAERDYYSLHLKKDATVKEIIPHPQFEIIPSYEVECKKCFGKGTIQNPQTGNANKCRRCKFGKVQKRGRMYTADFRVVYIDGYEEIIDVKGWKAERDFPLRKTLYEIVTGKELIVVRKDKKTKQWKRE